MQKVIGLDIGSYSVKAVEIVNTLNSYEISSFYENVIPQIDEVNPDIVIPAAMEQLFKENQLEADRIVTAMPGQFISSRIMSFNFSDPQKIGAAILAEVEDIVPYNLEDMIVDHQILGPMGGKTAALVVMTKKVFLRSFLEHLQRIDIDPKLVDVDSLAFYNLNSFLDVDPEQCISIVDVGHEKTSLCIIQNRVLRMFRSINLGGRYLTEFLARDMEVDYNEAQRIKHKVSRLAFDGAEDLNSNSEEDLIAYRLTLASNAIIKELGRTFYAFKTWEKTPVSKVFLSGGTSKIKGFDRYLQEQLEISVSKSDLSSTDLKINPELTDKMETMSQSISIGMRSVTAVKRATQINLRKGEFAFVQDYEVMLKAVGLAVRLVAIVMVTLGVSFGIHYFVYNKKINDNKEAYIKRYASIFPNAAKPRKAMSFSKLRNDAKTEMSILQAKNQVAIDEFKNSSMASPAIIILSRISEAVPKDLKVDVTEYEFNSNGEGGGKLILRGDTDSYESVSKILASVRKVAGLSSAVEKNSSPKPGSDNKIIDFVIEASYEPSELNEGSS